ncbi:MAG: hypothetical protein QXK42_00480 [Candidatus Korarchaeum sp.]
METLTKYPAGLDWGFYYRHTLNLTPIGVVERLCDGTLFYSPFVLPFIIIYPFINFKIIGMKAAGLLIFFISMALMVKYCELYELLPWFTYPAIVISTTYWANLLALAFFFSYLRSEGVLRKIYFALGALSHPLFLVLILIRLMKEGGLISPIIRKGALLLIPLIIFLPTFFHNKGNVVGTALGLALLLLLVRFGFASRYGEVRTLGISLLPLYAGRGIFFSCLGGKVGLVILVALTLVQPFFPIYTTDIVRDPPDSLVLELAKEPCLLLNDVRLLSVLAYLSGNVLIP